MLIVDHITSHLLGCELQAKPLTKKVTGEMKLHK